MSARTQPTRKQLQKSLAYFTGQGYKRPAAIAEIAKNRKLFIIDVEKILAYVPTGRPRKEKTKKPRPADVIGVCCECGQTKALARRALQSICPACVLARKPNPDYEHTPEEMEALKSEARARRAAQRFRHDSERKSEPFTIPVIQQLGVLNGRAGSWSAYE